jgi:hypothetical protein
VERRDTKNLTADRDEEAPLGELSSQSNIVRRKREYPMAMGYASRRLDVRLLDYSRRQF